MARCHLHRPLSPDDLYALVFLARADGHGAELAELDPMPGDSPADMLRRVPRWRRRHMVRILLRYGSIGGVERWADLMDDEVGKSFTSSMLRRKGR
jgi:hypothetical protein